MSSLLFTTYIWYYLYFLSLFHLKVFFHYNINVNLFQSKPVPFSPPKTFTYYQLMQLAADFDSLAQCCEYELGFRIYDVLSVMRRKCGKT